MTAAASRWTSGEGSTCIMRRRAGTRTRRTATRYAPARRSYGRAFGRLVTRRRPSRRSTGGRRRRRRICRPGRRGSSDALRSACVRWRGLTARANCWTLSSAALFNAGALLSSRFPGVVSRGLARSLRSAKRGRPRCLGVAQPTGRSALCACTSRTVAGGFGIPRVSLVCGPLLCDSNIFGGASCTSSAAAGQPSRQPMQPCRRSGDAGWWPPTTARRKP